MRRDSDRRIRNHEEHNKERWLVSYADFITLMFAFFVVLYATGQQDVKKMKDFEKNVRKQFKILMAQVNVHGGSGSSGAGGSQAGSAMSILNNTKAGPREIGQAIDTILEGQMTGAERNEALQSLRAESSGVRLSMAAGNYFNTSSSRIRTESIPTLKKIGSVLSQTNRRIIVEGHSHLTKGELGSFPSNWELSATQATKVLRYLIQYHKIPKENIISVAYGNTRPVTANSKDPVNQRIEILVVTEDLGY
ncbi:MAG: flagellar motor protein MotB [Bdellovibrionales bacterium]